MSTNPESPPDEPTPLLDVSELSESELFSSSIADYLEAVAPHAVGGDVTGSPLTVGETGAESEITDG